MTRIGCVTLALLGGALAWRTSSHVGVWRSEEALWTAAAGVAPAAPRPIINLAVAKLRVGDLDGAEALLWQAVPRVARLPPFERTWATDILEANWAVIEIGRGDVEAAHRRLQGAPRYSARAALCQQVPTVCQ